MFEIFYAMVSIRDSVGYHDANKYMTHQLTRLTSLLCLYAPMALGQLAHNPWSPFLRSVQGQHDKRDVVDHKRVSQGANLVCYSIESHPRQGDDGKACLLKFVDAGTHVLSFKDSIKVTKDDEVYLECLGDRPTTCQVGIWFDKSEQPQ